MLAIIEAPLFLVGHAWPFSKTMDSMNNAYFALKRPVGGLYMLLHLSCRVAKAVEIKQWGFQKHHDWYNRSNGKLFY